MMLDSDPYDLCIVGSGVAGALIADVAGRRGKRVVIVEAGSYFDRGKRIEQIQKHQILGSELWPWENLGRDGFVDSSKEDLGYKYQLNGSRIKAVGGSTLHWGGLVNRFWPSDFNSAERWGLGGDWPIKYQELERYYCLAEEELGVAGKSNPLDPPRSQPHPMGAFPPKYSEQAWFQVADKLGISLDSASHARNSQPYRGRPQCQAFAVCNACPIGARYSADFHVDHAIATGNVELLTETVARRIDVGDDRNVHQIRAMTLEGKELEIKAKKYVIAAHGVETARLMLLSNVGNESDQVGRNLMEHWYVGASGFVDEKTFPGRIGFATLESSHWYDSPQREDRGAIKIDFIENRDSLADGIELGLSGAELANFDCTHFGHRVGVAAEIEQLPSPNSRVTLHPETVDMFGDSVPHVQFSLSEIDKATHRHAQDILLMLLEARGCSDQKITHNFNRAHHHMGTCRMSSNPDSGVVSKDCRVYGTNNLYLAGSSVFTTGGAHQPTLTIAALALRLADHLTTIP
jgi:choline dehydrogenase-like flavoprotein